MTSAEEWMLYISVSHVLIYDLMHDLFDTKAWTKIKSVVDFSEE